MGEENREVKFNIPTNLVKRNEDNPRLIFSEEGMLRLMKSIKEVGILVPLTVYREGPNYVILDGERRWRAAQRINLQTVPCYILPKPATKVEYILNMFKIHNVREEWMLLPTALKLAQVIEQIEMQTGNAKISNQELATYTGLSSAAVGRCRRLLTLPKKYQDMLFEEEKLAEKGIKPTKTTLSEDFFLELLRAISAIESRKSEMERIFDKYSKDQIISCFVDKFKSGNIPDITDFRYLTKLVKQTKLPLEKRERVLIRILKEADYRIDEAYDVYARPFYESEGLGKQLDKIEMILESLEIDLLDRGSSIVVLNSLENFKKIVQNKISELKKKLGRDEKTAS
jgi:ParB/RepB/Spo0J family partition protein